MEKGTLEEAAEHNYPGGDVWTEEQAVIRRLAFKNGANWQAERMYSEEECYRTLHNLMTDIKLKGLTINDDIDLKIWFEQVKKK